MAVAECARKTPLVPKCSFSVCVNMNLNTLHFVLFETGANIVATRLHCRDPLEIIVLGVPETITCVSRRLRNPAPAE